MGDRRLLIALADYPQHQAEFICAIAIARPDGTIALENESKPLTREFRNMWSS